MENRVTLNGHALSLEALFEIASGQAMVDLCPQALSDVECAHRVLLDSVLKGKRIYGASCGVGWNKDRPVDCAYQSDFNRSLLRSHAVSLPPYATVAEVRAMMAIRLNKALLGYSGLSQEVVKRFRDFLNYGITPRLPKRGSIGEADIATLSHIGLAMIGEGEVDFQGKQRTALDAMADCGLKPLTLGPKDGLGIISSNAHGEAVTSMLVREARILLNWSNLIFCLSLEGLQGSLMPFREEVNQIRRQRGQAYCASVVRHHLRDSYLCRIGMTQALQDPLSFRSAAAIHGACFEALDEVESQLEAQINTSDDNPAILWEIGEIMVTTNFETVSLALAVEKLSIALAHLSRTLVFRCFRLGDPVFTGLGRFLTPDERACIAFGTVQKTLQALDTEIRHLAQPASFDFLALAGQIEDHACNLPFVVEKARSIIATMQYIAAAELMHAAQAVDLRSIKDELAFDTRALWERVRCLVPAYLTDRCLTCDLEVLQNYLATNHVEGLLASSLGQCSRDYSSESPINL